MNLEMITSLPGYPLSLVSAVLASLALLVLLLGLRWGRQRGQADLAPELSQHNERHQQLRVQLDESQLRAEQQQQKLEYLQQQLSHEQQRSAGLTAQLSSLEKHSQESLSQLKENQQQALTSLRTEFKNTANTLLEEKSKSFSELNQKEIGSLLSPLREQIQRFEKQVDDRYGSESRERHSLVKEITALKELNNRLGTEAQNLTTALVGQAKTQGSWGELVLEQVLEKSGLENGREFDREVSLKNSDGKTFRPDVIVHLPGDREVIIDSKVSLVAYERYANADDDETRAQALKEHIASIRRHVKDLSSKNYPDLLPGKTLDFVFIFIPVESAFIEAVRNDTTLYDEAFQANIGLVAPSTLLGMLRVIHNLWQNDKQNKNALEIARKAGSLYDKMVGFVEDIDKVGAQLDTTRKTWESARNKLTQGRGNLIRTSEQIKKLGAKTAKQLPDSTLANLSEADESGE